MKNWFSEVERFVPGGLAVQGKRMGQRMLPVALVAAAALTAASLAGCGGSGSSSDATATGGATSDSIYAITKSSQYDKSGALTFVTSYDLDDQGIWSHVTYERYTTGDGAVSRTPVATAEGTFISDDAGNITGYSGKQIKTGTQDVDGTKKRVIQIVDGSYTNKVEERNADGVASRYTTSDSSGKTTTRTESEFYPSGMYESTKITYLDTSAGYEWSAKSYDEQGFLVQSSLCYTSGYVYNVPYTYDYDSSGKAIGFTYLPDPDMTFTCTIEYDKSGNLSKVVNNDGSYTVYEYALVAHPCMKAKVTANQKPI